MKREKYLREHSNKYLATIFQIIGIAFATPMSSKVFRSLYEKEIAELGFASPSFFVSLVLLLTGGVLFYIGYVTMMNVDRGKFVKVKK